LTAISRREFLLGAAAAFGIAPSQPAPRGATAQVLNDVHSRLNPTSVDRVVRISSTEMLLHTLDVARRESKPVSIAGSRHAAGGQQFGSGMIVADMRGLRRVLEFDADRGQIEVEAGIEWPALMDHLHQVQAGPGGWGIIQKQGVDPITLGGTLAA